MIKIKLSNNQEVEVHPESWNALINKESDILNSNSNSQVVNSHEIKG